MSKKYLKFYRSRSDYPTKDNQKPGHKDARVSIEKEIGRPLSAQTKVRKCGGNWVFCEPRPSVG